ncbi:hypothetical protein [Pseudomonas syringae]|uniref:hypothetical protein n=1 Tax=Pseudomonas syringae TaxID=317 RepID=UPI0018E61092|nr:hypothetical protein [Pseudomonas syringae]MBI6764481.1 hypothetical protein [Pseudomonas syringae]MBI6785308.1 hypothetical protein [Pseudomonas syringae]
MSEQKRGKPIKASPEKTEADITTITGKAPTKISRILTYLLQGQSLNRFEAERLGDHCLHSTISTLANGYGLKFERQLERVPNHCGEPCTVARYTLPASERARGRNVQLMLCNLTQRQKVAA